MGIILLLLSVHEYFRISSRYNDSKNTKRLHYFFRNIFFRPCNLPQKHAGTLDFTGLSSIHEKQELTKKDPDKNDKKIVENYFFETQATIKIYCV
ncbi:MAG TPA: hypothetical protein VK177_00845 [Flavobacteriales bacterium]|nr:hypothetical protein [Flavobacteriales bacterium]